MSPDHDEAPDDIKVVGGAEPRPRRRSDDLSSIRSRSRTGRGQDVDRPPPPPAPPRPASADDGGVDRRSYNLLIAITALLAVIAMVFALAWGFGWGHDRSRKVVLSAGSKDVKEMSTVARSFATSFTNYDPESIDRIFNQINDLATGQFAQDWPTKDMPKTARDSLRAGRAQIRGEIKDLFVQNFNDHSGEVFSVVDVTYTNNSNPQPIPDTLRFDIHLVKVDGDWKINDVELLNSPGATSGVGLVPGESTTTTTPH